MSQIATDKTILVGKNLVLGYRKGKVSNVVAEEISFSLEKGKLTCLLGPNGVGKSTLLKAIMGHNKPLAGTLVFAEKKLADYSPKMLAKKIAVVLTDKVSTGNLTVAQLVALGRIPHTGWMGGLSEMDRIKVEQAIESTHIGYLHDRRLSELSDGQLQKVMIARALAQDGEVLILDEPTAHLDLINRFEIMQLLRSIAIQQDKAILVVTHDLEIAIETADQFWIMQCGFPLTAGTPEDLILDGRINLLLPHDKLTFDSLSGKVQASTSFQYSGIVGPEAWMKWVKLALRKNEIDSIYYTSIQLDSVSGKIILNSGNGKVVIEKIATLIEKLKSFQEKNSFG